MPVTKRMRAIAADIAERERATAATNRGTDRLLTKASKVHALALYNVLAGLLAWEAHARPCGFNDECWRSARELREKIRDTAFNPVEER